ncbi:MAG: HNH endonuclease [Anaerolineae bacterium]|nr:HNH endonuclease [Anaerolineae bacterium]
MSSHTLVQRFGAKIAARDGGWYCVYCGCTLTNDPKQPNAANKACVDHIHPQARGGKDDMENFVLCCRICNSKKGSKAIYPLRIRQAVWSWVADRFTRAY